MKEDLVKNIYKIIKDQNIQKALSKIHSEYLGIDGDLAEKIIERKLQKQILIMTDKLDANFVPQSMNEKDFEKDYKEIKG